MQQNILDTEVTTIDGEKRSLSAWRGKVLLVVNVASKCGLTPQYEQGDAIGGAAEGFDLLFRARLLPEELVAWEAQHAKTFPFPRFLQVFQLLVLRRQATF